MKTEVAFRDSLWVNCTPGLRQPTSAQLHQEGGKRCQAARGQIYEGVSAVSSRSVEAVRQHLGAVEGVRCPSAAVCLARSIGADGRGRRPPSRWSIVNAARVWYWSPGFGCQASRWRRPWIACWAIGQGPASSPSIMARSFSRRHWKIGLSPRSANGLHQASETRGKCLH